MQTAQLRHIVSCRVTVVESPSNRRMYALRSLPLPHRPVCCGRRTNPWRRRDEGVRSLRCQQNHQNLIASRYRLSVVRCLSDEIYAPLTPWRDITLKSIGFCNLHQVFVGMSTPSHGKKHKLVIMQTSGNHS